MISGIRNLVYFSRGKRFYGRKPIPARARGLWEITFVLSGRARPHGVDCPPPTGDGVRLYLSPPDSSHGWTDDPDGESEIIVLHFRDVPDELRDCVTPATSNLVELSRASFRRLVPLIDAIWDNSTTKTSAASLRVQRLLVEIVQETLDHLGRPTSGAVSSDVVGRALHWMEENLAEHPEVTDAARAVGVSPPHLRRLFAVEGRASPHTELLRIKMQAAQQLLRARWKQEAIASYLGYSDVSSFARVFRTVCGMPPGSWLARNP